jgi:hypothetical protein
VVCVLAVGVGLGLTGLVAGPALGASNYGQSGPVNESAAVI